MSKLIIVGGGASGLTTAIIAARKGHEVVILERNNIVAKKVLITGNGKCNYWNNDQDLKHYHSFNRELLKDIITENNQQKTLDFLNSIGIIPKIKNGYYYPYSNQAVGVKAALLNELEILGVKIFLNAYVKNCKKINNKFIVQTEKEEYKSDYLVIANGSKAAFKNDFKFNGYQLAESFSHNIIPILPSLTQIWGKGNFKEWSGIRVDAALSLYENNELKQIEYGELHLTDYGISGICTFNLSGLVAKGLAEGKKEIIRINFLPDLKCDELNLITLITKRDKLLKNRTIDKLFDGFINYKLVYWFLKILNIDKNIYWEDLTDNKKNELVKCLLNYKFEVLKTNDFEKAQVCSGGVSLNEINPQTLESLKVKNLYFTGEILDIDGDCGGYNLGFAWLSGVIVGNSLGEKNVKS